MSRIGSETVLSFLSPYTMPGLWTPLESNPEVITEYAASLGLEKEAIQFCDILSTEEWALAMIPKPVHAVIMVFPIKTSSENRSAEQKERILKDGQHVSKGIYYMQQTVANACGTIALLHAIGNLPKELFDSVVKKDSYLHKFFSNTKGIEEKKEETSAEPVAQKMSPSAIAKYLEEDDAIDALHSEASNKGQSEAPPDNLTNNHFVCFTLADGCVYELDGRKAFPINHGSVQSILKADSDPSTEEDSMLLEAAIAVIRKEFMDPDPEELQFTFLAVTGADSANQ